MIRPAAFLGSALLHLACAQLVPLAPLAGLKVTEPSLVDRSADLAGLGIVTDLGSGSTIQLFDVLDDPCLSKRGGARKPEFLARAETCFPTDAPAPVWRVD